MDKLNEILTRDAIRVNDKVALDSILGKHILITGASGLIGINFLMSIKEFYKKNGGGTLPRVTAFIHSDLPDYLQNAVSFEGLEIKKGDITDPTFLGQIVEADIIIHAAGYGQPGKFLKDKVKTIAINTTATMALLSKLSKDGKFLFLSTSELYNGLINSPFKEEEVGTTNTTDPRSCYIEGKRCGEAICNAYFEMGRSVRSARLSLAYGPGTKIGDKRVMNSFIEKGLAGEIEMMDSGAARRTYCYVSDAIETLWNILLFGTKPIYNVGGFSTLTIADLAEKIADILKVKVVIPDSGTQLSGAPNNVELSLEKIVEEFGKRKEGFVKIDEGLKDTIEWQKEIYKISK